MNKKIELGMAIILLLSAAVLSRRETMEVIMTAGSSTLTVNENCIVIDAGHGGDDPGKIGINGTLEKDVRFPATGVPDGWWLFCGCWELIQDHLREQLVSVLSHWPPSQFIISVPGTFQFI